MNLQGSRAYLLLAAVALSSALVGGSLMPKTPSSTTASATTCCPCPDDGGTDAPDDAPIDAAPDALADAPVDAPAPDAAPCAPSATWASLGLNTIDGGATAVRVQAIAFLPGKIFATAFGTSSPPSGVYRSLDNGSSWQLANVPGPAYRVLSLGARQSTGTLIAGANDSFGSTIGFRVFRSTDAGVTWTSVLSGAPPGMSVEVQANKIAVDQAGGVFYAGVGGGAGRTIYRSTDDGVTWTERDAGWPQNPVTTTLGLAVDSTSALWAGTENYKILFSSDQGGTWTYKNTGLPSGNSNHTGFAFLPGVVLASRGTGSPAGVWKSVDYGANWTNTPGLGGMSINDVTASNGVAYVGGFNSVGSGVWSSVDAGGTWVQQNNGLTDVQVYTVVAGLDGAMYAGTKTAGVFRSAPVCP